MNNILAEARVHGILRGGHIIDDKFCFHACGYYEVDAKGLDSLRVLEEKDK